MKFTFFIVFACVIIAGFLLTNSLCDDEYDDIAFRKKGHDNDNEDYEDENKKKKKKKVEKENNKNKSINTQQDNKISSNLKVKKNIEKNNDPLFNKNLKVKPINRQQINNQNLNKNFNNNMQAENFNLRNDKVLDLNNYLINNLQTDLKTESVEFALPEINIDRHEKIEHYYPYFYKNRLIEINNLMNMRDSVSNYNTMQSSIPLALCDSSCEKCHSQKLICLQCYIGFFLLDNKCFNACPNGYVADVYKRQCVHLSLRRKNTFTRITYLKAFSNGSCRNICGRVSIDCSCEADCVNKGTCCSDYNDCEVLFRKNLNKKDECEKTNPSCELCSDLDNNTNKCGQCKTGLYLKSEKCVNECGINDKIRNDNKLCLNIERCLVENCLECENDNPSVCRRCMNGLFLYNNMCNASCPGMLRADRMNWMCMEAPVFAWFWVFPSKSSCRNNCDAPMGVNLNMDCSCTNDCYKFGNCCPDIEDYCYKFLISNN